MKHNLNRVLSTLALLLLTCIGLWAGEVIKVVKPDANAGTVVSTVSDGVCTLTVTPATGFYLTADNLQAVETLNENGMQAPRRNLPINPGEELLITPTDANANPSGVTTYTFNLPEDENINVEVTAVFQEGSYYNLKIGDTWVTSANAAAIHEIGDEYIRVAEGGSVSFDATNSILTLNNATLKHGITSGLDNLTIQFVGTNKVNSDSQEKWQDTQDAAQNNAISTEVGTATLTFEKAGEGSLELYSKTSLFYPVIAGFASVGYGSGNNQCYLQTSKPSIYNTASKRLENFYEGAGITNATITSVVSYPLWVGSYPLVQVTEENEGNITGNFINEEGSMQYIPSLQKLSLVNAEISGKIHSALGNLTLEFTGVNQITTSDTGTVVRSANAGELRIQKKAGETNASLKLESYDWGYDPHYPVVQGFATLNYEGLNMGTNVSSPAYGQFIGVPDQSGEYVSVYGLYDSDAESGGEKGITSATFTTADVFPLWVGGTQVTGDNAENITANAIDGMVSFDEENKILTLNNTNISCEEILADFPIKSGYDDLTIKLIGNSYITIDSDYPSLIQYVGGQLEVSPQLTFMYDDNGDEGYGSLIISGIESPENLAEGYVVTNVLLSAEEHPSSTGWLYETDEEEGDFMLWYQEAYGIVVTKDGKSYGITKENISNVLGEEDTEPTVKFDGHGRLVLNKAQLTSISVAPDNDLPIVDPQNKTKGLEIYLEGDNTITNNLGFAVKSEGDAADLNLTFLTGSDAPGTLTYTNNGAASGNVFPGFNVKYLNNLAKTTTTDGKVTMVKIPLGLFVETVGTPVTVTYTSSPAGDDANRLDNVICDDVLYTLDDNGTKESKDGYDQEKKMVVINNVMTDAEVKAIDTSETIPGTEAYSNAFKGLTLLVPAGTGTITLNNVQTAEGYAFHVMVGYQEPPLEIINNGTPTNVTVSFACTETSYVKIYLVALPTPAPAYAQAVGGHRIGPKSSVAGGLGGISVQGNTINVAPDPAASYLMMTASDCTNDGGRGIKINNGNVTDLPPSAFSGISFVSPSPRRAPDANMKTYIDASGTMITGKNFSRTEGAFKDVPEETLIYLPAGNTAVGKNFIIGGICEEMELKAMRVNPFEAAADFTAAKATFDRVFVNGDDKYYTIFLPYALNVSEVDGELFEYVSYTTETVNMKKLTAGATTPNKAYIFKPSNTAALKPMLNKQVKKQLAGTAAAPDDESEAEGLHGVYEYYMWTSKPSNVYCYSASDQGSVKQGQFAKVGVNTHIKPFRAYLRLNTSSAPEFISVDWGDGMTSIVPLDKEQIHQDADGWYTISGFRLPNKPTEKGIYIHNHKKTVVK